MGGQDAALKELMEFLEERMLTKEDGENFATKKDLERFATKEDLDNGLGALKHELLSAMDDKLANLKADMVILMRKEDKKVTELIKLLATKQVISKDEARTLFSMEPFPQT